jgi:cyclase
METLFDDVLAFVQPDGSWGLSNGGLVYCDESVVLIDTCFTERRNRALVEMVRNVTPKPVKVLVNTHHHGDHTYGNGWFPEATIVAHRYTRQAICRLDPATSMQRFTTVDFGEVRPTPPMITFEDAVTLHVGELALDVLSPGVSHSGGDAVVHLPERSVLFAGDVVLNGCTPGFVGGSAKGYLDVLDQLRLLEVDTIVPGHGPICDASVLDDMERYVRLVLHIAEEGRSAGLSPLEAARRADLGEFRSWINPERIIGNLYRAYKDIDDGTSANPVDWGAMWVDTECLAGHPLSSIA